MLSLRVRYDVVSTFRKRIKQRVIRLIMLRTAMTILVLLSLSEYAILVDGVFANSDNATSFSIGPFTGSLDLGQGQAPEVMAWGPEKGYPRDRTPLNYTVENGVAIAHPTYGPDYTEYTVCSGDVRIALILFASNVSELDLRTLDCNDGNPLNWERDLPVNLTIETISGKNVTIIEGKTEAYNKYAPTLDIPTKFGAGFLISPRAVCFINAWGSGERLNEIQSEFRSVVHSLRIDLA